MEIAPTQIDLARRFAALHQDPSLLVLPCAWDVISAKLYEREGFSALGTTSAGIAAVLGYADGERMGRDEMLQVARGIASRIEIPLSIDIEAGYARTPEDVSNTARLAILAGAVGINLEDGTGDPSAPLFDMSYQCACIAAIREMADQEGLPLFINARVDGLLIGETNLVKALSDVIRRSVAYRGAGADGIFVPDVSGLLDRSVLVDLVREVEAPLNIIAGPRTPRVGELEAMGVARLSLGPRAMRSCLALVRDMARECRDRGTYDLMNARTLSYDEINAMLS